MTCRSGRGNTGAFSAADCAARVGLGSEALSGAGTLLVVRSRCLFVVDHGRGAPVLFLHGIPTSSYLWRDVLPPVAQRLRCLAPDLLGFGFSEKPPHGDFGVVAQAELLRALLDELGLDRVSLVAHDYGALVAAELLDRQPERIDRLVLTNTSLRRGQWRAAGPLALLRLPLLGELAMWLARRWMLKLAMRLYVSEHARLTEAVMARYWWPFEHGFKGTLLRLSRERWAGAGDFARWRAALSRFVSPSMIVWGARDPTFTLAEVRDLHGLLPHATVVPLRAANHFVQEDAPIELARLLGDFLAS